MGFIVHSYICKKLSYSLIGISLVMTAFVVIFVFIGELEAQRNDYNMEEALWYTLMMTPSISLAVLPFVCLVSVFIVVSNMMENREIVILQTGGMSLSRMHVIVLLFMFFLACMFVAADQFIFSRVNAYAIAFKERHKYPDKQAGTIDFWINEDQSMIYLDLVHSNGQIGNAYIYSFDDDHSITEIQKSSSGQIQNRLFRFFSVDRTVMSNTSMVGSTNNTSVQIDTDYNVDFRHFEQSDPQYLSLTNLVGIATYQMTQKAGPNPYWATFISKILMPINICALVFLALALIFGAQRSFSPGSHVLIGIMIGLIFYFISSLTVPMHMAFDISAVITTLFPGLLAIVVALTIRKFPIIT